MLWEQVCVKGTIFYTTGFLVSLGVLDSGFFIGSLILSNKGIGKSYNGRVIEKSGDLAMYLLEEGHVACVGGDAFGAPNCIRMSYATSDENLVKAFGWIKEALAKLS